MVVSAGNRNALSSTRSPARMNEVITVSASEMTDVRWKQLELGYGAGHGPAVDLFAPGHNVTSCYKGGNDATEQMDGTSHVRDSISLHHRY